MKRYPAFDPPEYLTWEADPALVTAYRERCAADPERQAIVDALAPNDLVSLYRDLLRTRLHDIGLKRWVRTGVISKSWLGTGEEAVTVGSVRALDPGRDDRSSPMIRNAGALHMMGMPLSDMFRGYLATSDSAQPRPGSPYRRHGEGHHSAHQSHGNECDDRRRRGSGPSATGVRTGSQ